MQEKRSKYFVKRPEADMRDPICGMEVKEPPKVRLEKDGVLYGFCAEVCKKRFAEGNGPIPMRRASSAIKGYFFLSLIIFSIFLFVWIKASLARDFSAHSLAGDGMAAFFLLFGIFKTLDLKAFAEAYATYDLIAGKSRAYAMAYPFIQISLGSAYLFRVGEPAIHYASMVLMLVSALGVFKALSSGKKLTCACLGTRISMPMTVVSLIEDVSMVCMAAWMLWGMPF